MNESMRERYGAIFRHRLGTERPGDKTPGEIADLILAVRDEELERLRSEVERLTVVGNRWKLQAEQAEAAIERVRNLHWSMTHGGITICGHCSGWNGFRCGGVVQPHPCPTLADLDAPEAPGGAS